MVRTSMQCPVLSVQATARCLGKKVRTGILLQYSFSASTGGGSVCGAIQLNSSLRRISQDIFSPVSVDSYCHLTMDSVCVYI